MQDDFQTLLSVNISMTLRSM